MTASHQDFSKLTAILKDIKTLKNTDSLRKHLAKGGTPEIRRLATMGFMPLLLAACKSNSSDNSSDTTSGIVSDGYIAFARVFRDLNDNGSFDAESEVAVETGADGSFSNLTGTGGVIIAEPTDKSYDISTGKAFDAILTAPAGSGVVTPLTTLVQSVIDNSGGTAAEAEAQVKAALGLETTDNLLSTDFFAQASEGDADALAVQTAAVKVAAVMLAGTSLGGGASGGKAAMDALAGQLSGSGEIEVTADLLKTVLGAANGDDNLGNQAADALLGLFAEIDAIASQPGVGLTNIVAAQIGGTSAVVEGISDGSLNSSDFLSGLSDAISEAENQVNLTPPDTSDETAPIATVNIDATALNGTDTATVTIVFSEKPVRFELGDLSAENATLSNLSGPTINEAGEYIYTATLTPTANTEATGNTVTLGTGYTDAAGNAPEATATSATFDVDTTAPTASVSIDAASLADADTATVTITFSEAVTGFTVDDLSADSAILSNLTQSAANPLVYTATLTPTANTEATGNTVTLGTGYTDAAGNAPEAAATSATFDVDTTAPTASVSIDAASLAGADTATVTITFSEAVTGFTVDDLSAGSAILSNLTQSAANPLVYTATLTPTANTEATGNTVTLGTGYTDAAGNAPEAAATSATFDVDTTAPTASVSIDATSLVGADTATVTITFSEAVTGFTVDDLSAGSATLSDLAQSGTNPLIYTATLTPNDGVDAAGNLVTLGTSYTDVAGNAPASTAKSDTYDIDTKAPDIGTVSFASVTSSTLDPTPSDAITNKATGTIRFSYDGADLSAGESLQASLDGQNWLGLPQFVDANAFIQSQSVNTDANTISFAASLTGSPTIQLRAIDDVGNATGILANQTITYDDTAPELLQSQVSFVSISSDINDQNTADTFTNVSTATATYNVTGLAADDVLQVRVNNGTWETTTVTDGVASLTDVDLSAGTYSSNELAYLNDVEFRVLDAAGNEGGALLNGGTWTYASHNLYLDNIAPTVTSIDMPAADSYGAGDTPDNLTFTVNLSEAVIPSDTPSLAIVIGSNARTATYDAASSTSTTLVFKYTVTNSDTSDVNGTDVVQVTSLSLNGVDNVGNVANATINTTTVNNVIVDGGTSGSGIDGYLEGVTIFADNDGDRALSEGDAVAVTNSTGGFTIYGANGPLIMYGGTDISTGITFNSQYEAPEGFTTITPISTLIRTVERLDTTGGTDAPTAYETIRSAIYGTTGGPDYQTVTSYDPFSVVTGSDATASANAVEYQRVAASIATVVEIASEAMITIESGLSDQRTASVLVFEELADVLSTSYTPGNLETDLADASDAGFLETLITALVPNATTDQIVAIADVIGGAISTIQGAGADQDDLTQLTEIIRVQVVAQGDAADSLIAYLNDPNAGIMDQNAFDNAVNTASVGVIVPVQYDIATDTSNADVYEGQPGDSAVLRFIVTRSGNTATESTVEYVISGVGSSSSDDFDGNALPSGSITFADGQTEAVIEVAINGDTIREGDESFSVELIDPSGTAKMGVSKVFGTIQDDDPFVPEVTLMQIDDLAAGQTAAVPVSIDYFRDDVNDPLTVTISGTNLTPSETTLTGSLSQINAALANLTVTGTGGETQAELFVSVSVAGRGNTASQSFTIHNAPVAQETSSLSVDAGLATNLFTKGELTVADVDGDDLTLTIKSDYGVFSVTDSMPSNVILTEDGAEIVGTASAINDALQAISFTALPGLTSGKVYYSLDDGDALTSSVAGTLDLTINASAPELTTPDSNVYVKEAAASPIAGLSVSDVDSGLLEVTLTASGGQLNAPGAVATETGLVLSGTAAEINQALTDLTMTANVGEVPSLSVTVSDNDPNTSDVTQTVSFNVVANAAPNAGGVPTTVDPVAEDSTPNTVNLTLKPAVLTDEDGPTPENIRIMSVSGGQLTDATGGAITLGGAGTLLSIVGGSVGLQFTPDADLTSGASLSYVVVDAVLETLNSAATKIDIPIAAVNDAPEISVGSAQISFVEGAAPVDIAPGLTLTDIDSPTMSEAVVTITNAAADDALYLDGSTPLTVTGSGTSTLTISGVASRAEYQALLRNITFGNSSDDPTVGNRSIQIDVTDVDADGASALTASFTQAVSVSAVNDMAVIDGVTDTPLTPSEGDAAIPVAPTITLTDPDNTNIASATVKIVSGYNQASDVLSASGIPSSITASFDSTTGILTLTGEASMADYQTALQAVAYQNTSDAPGSAQRELFVEVTDALGLNVTSHMASIAPQEVSDAPEIDLNGGQQAGLNAVTTYISALHPDGLRLVPNADLSDVDSKKITSVTITLNNAQTDDALELSDAGIAYAASNGVAFTHQGNGVYLLNASGALALSKFESILQQVEFISTHTLANGVETGPERTVDFVAVDEDGTTTSGASTITIKQVASAFATVASGTQTLTLTGTPDSSTVRIDLPNNSVIGDAGKIEADGDSLFTVMHVDASAVTAVGVGIKGDANDNSLTGSDQADIFLTGGGADIVSAGDGDDVIFFNSNATIDGGLGVDTLVVNGTFDLSAATGVSNVEIIDAGHTTSGISLTGGTNAEELIGGSGNDTIVSAGGDDTLVGGKGTDTFDVSAASSNTVVIRDLEIGDQIKLGTTGSINTDPTSQIVTITFGTSTVDLGVISHSDPADWVFDTNTNTYTVVRAPGQTATLTSMSHDTGDSATDFVTNDGSTGRIFKGSLDSALFTGQRVEISLNGGANWHSATTVDNRWSVIDPTTTTWTTSQTVSVRVYDTLSATAGTVTTQTITLDTTGPTVSSGTAVTILEYDQAITSLTADEPVTWSLADQTAGVSLNQADLSFDSPATVGTHTITVIATDVAGNKTSTDMTVTVKNVNDDPTGSVDIVGVAIEDNTLKVDTSTLADADGLGTFSYQWFADGNLIEGETGQTLFLPQIAVGSQITVQVSYTDLHGTTEVVQSAATAVVQNLNDTATGSISIIGDAIEDSTLTVDVSGLADEDGIASLYYQWLAGGAIIEGETGDSLSLSQEDVGSAVSVQVTIEDKFGNVEAPIVSAETTPVQNVNDVATGSISITGDAIEDSILKIDISALTDEDGIGSLAYKWFADGQVITNATTDTLQLSQAEVSRIITAEVTITDAYGNQEAPFLSSGTLAVQNINDVATGSISIIGNAIEDATLTVDVSSIVDEDEIGSLEYQWFADGIAVDGQIGESIVLSQEAVGSKISVQVTMTDAFGNVEAPFTSAKTAPVQNVNDIATGTVVIVGDAKEGSTLKADASDILDEDGIASLTYQWYADSTAISGATGESLLLTQEAVGSTLSVEVIVTDDFNNVEAPISSDVTAPVQNVNDAPTGGIKITGLAADGNTLNVDTSTLNDADGMGEALSYQWLADGLAISGATTDMLILSQSNIGTVISVDVSYTDQQGTFETVSDSMTEAVRPTVQLTEGNDLYQGTDASKQVLLLSGDDEINMSGGSDIIDGGDGYDVLYLGDVELLNVIEGTERGLEFATSGTNTVAYSLAEKAPGQFLLTNATTGVETYIGNIEALGTANGGLEAIAIDTYQPVEGITRVDGTAWTDEYDIDLDAILGATATGTLSYDVATSTDVSTLLGTFTESGATVATLEEVSINGEVVVGLIQNGDTSAIVEFNEMELLNVTWNGAVLEDLDVSLTSIA